MTIDPHDAATLAPARAPEPQRRPAEAGVAWFKQGWTLFRRQPWTWVGMTLILFAVPLMARLFGTLGALLGGLLQTLLPASFLLAAETVEGGGRIRLRDVFAVFASGQWPRLLGAVVVLWLLVAALGALVGVTVLHGAADTPPGLDAVPLLGLLGGLLVALLLTAAFLFAPALIVLDDVDLLEAFRLSLRGCLRNIWPLTVWSLLLMGLLLLGVLTLGLGFLVWVPLAQLSIWAAYRDIFARA